MSGLACIKITCKLAAVARKALGGYSNEAASVSSGSRSRGGSVKELGIVATKARELGGSGRRLRPPPFHCVGAASCILCRAFAAFSAYVFGQLEKYTCEVALLKQ